MRVASFNIWNGAQDDAAYSLLVDFITHHGLDVVCLQEANGWQEDNYARTRDFAGRTGLKHVLFGDSQTDSKLITYSRLPIDMERSQVHTEGFFHCAIQAFIEVDSKLVEVWNNHFDPFDEAKRVREARFVAAHAINGVAVGDFNGLSRLDGYDDDFVRALIESGNTRYLDGEDLQFKMTDYFTKEGYVDAASLRRSLVNTFPARLDTEDHPPKARFDYVFVPERLKKAVCGFEVIKNRWTKRISDHYPVIVTLEPELLAQDNVLKPAATQPAYTLAA